MAQAFTSEATINRPRPEVWAALTDWDQAPEWMGQIESMSADGPTVPGTELRFRARGKERPSLIATMTEGEAITLRSVQGGVSADYHYRLHEVDPSTTRLELTAECTTSGPWVLAGPMLRLLMKRTDGGQPHALKQLIEEG